MFLAALLSFGWPTPKVEFGPAKPHPGLVQSALSKCCGSMRPLIHGGETAYFEAYVGQPLTPGLVIVTPEALHMITAITDGAVRTTGIANRNSDDWTKKSDIKFILRYVVRP